MYIYIYIVYMEYIHPVADKNASDEHLRVSNSKVSY